MVQCVCLSGMRFGSHGWEVFSQSECFATRKSDILFTWKLELGTSGVQVLGSSKMSSVTRRSSCLLHMFHEIMKFALEAHKNIFTKLVLSDIMNLDSCLFIQWYIKPLCMFPSMYVFRIVVCTSLYTCGPCRRTEKPQNLLFSPPTYFFVMSNEWVADLSHRLRCKCHRSWVVFCKEPSFGVPIFSLSNSLDSKPLLLYCEMVL